MVALASIPEDFAGLPWTHGISGAVFQISEAAVIKKPLSGDTCRAQLDVERRIYERLGPHPYITSLLATHKDMIVLERLQYPLRQRLLDFRKNNQRPPSQTVVQWAWQIAQAFRHIHSCGVMQVDIGTYNVLLDWNEDVKLSDFAGSSLDGSEPTVAPSAHSTHPKFPITQPSIQSELFAVGSMLYEMETTFEPYHDKNDGELEDLFEGDQFPDTSDLVLGEVIRKCWAANYTDSIEVVVDIRQITDRLKPAAPGTPM